MEDLLLIPGMMCDRRLWAAQIEGLQARCRSITVADITQSETMEAIASDVLEAAPERFAVAGLSMGGMVALEMWRRTRESGSERITRLALLDTNAHAELSDRRQMRDDLIARALAGEFKAVITEALKPVYLAEQNKGNQPLLDVIFEMAMDMGTEVFERQCRALQTRSDAQALLPDIDVPVLVLCGDEDQLCPVSVHEGMAEAIPHSELRVIPCCGHLSTMEEPEQVNEALSRWLQA